MGDFVIENGVLKKPYKGSDTHVVIPDGVTQIDDYVFCLYKSLTSVEIPDSVILIYDGEVSADRYYFAGIV